MSYATDQCFEEIMCGPKQLQQSIQEFNEELLRITNTFLEDNDIDVKSNTFEH